MKTLLIRSLSGLAYILVLIGAILYGEWGIFFLGGLLLTLAANEGLKLLQITLPKPFVFCVLIPLYCFLAFPNGTSWPTPVALALPPIIFCSIILLNPKVAFEQASRFSLLIFYIFIPLCLLNTLYSQLAQVQIPLLLLWVLVIIWINDTGAYLVGSMIGKNKLWATVSPGKSWEGFAGGAIFAMLAGYILSLNIDLLNTWQAVLLGLWITVLSTMGDLFESSLKRTAGVKDSGTILPGHGGILDRIDSLLFVIPGVYGFLVVIEKIIL